MSLPIVTVVIPTYNRESTIKRCIESVLNQTYKLIELVVVDDGSTDRSAELAESFGSSIKVIRQSNAGPSSARNRGVIESSGEIIAFLDSDDTWKPDKLEKQITLLQKGGPDVPCCVCNADIVSDEGSVGTSFAISAVQSQVSEGFWMNPAPLIATRFLLFNQVVAVRRSAFEKIGGFNEDMRLLEDHDLAFRLSLLGPWAFISEPLVEKFNDADGIGVQAMAFPLVHARAWCSALNGFLNELAGTQPQITRWIKLELRNVAMEIRVMELDRSPNSASRILGRSLAFLLKASKAMNRRLPSWPSPQIALEITR